MYSGGLDSLGMVYKLLTDSEYSAYDVHIHHVHNKNIENRYKAEAIAVSLALKELKSLGFNFIYSESEIGTPMYGQNFMFDSDSINFLAGYVASVNLDIEKIAVGMQATDDGQTVAQRIDRANQILAAWTPVKKIYPVLDMSKREIYDSLPESLRELFWSCRHPVYTEKNIAPCGLCDTCVKLREQGIR